MFEVTGVSARITVSFEAKTMKKEIKNSSETSGTQFSYSSTPRILYNDLEFSVSSSGHPRRIEKAPVAAEYWIVLCRTMPPHDQE
jgi:hypothetical protein